MGTVRILSTDTDDGTITVVDKTGGTHEYLTQIRVGNAPRGGVKFTADGRGFVSNTSQNTISEIDVSNLAEVRRIVVGHGPRGIGVVPGGRYLLVSNSGSDTISVVDLLSNEEVRQIPCGRDPRHMAITGDGRSAFVCIWGDGVVARLDLAGLALGDPAEVCIDSTISVGDRAHPYSAALAPDGVSLFVANTQAPYVSVINIETGALTQVEVGAIGGRAVAFTPDGRFALATIETISQIAVIEVASLRVTRFVPTGPGPRGIAVDPGDLTAYVSAFDRAQVVHPDSPDYGPNTLTVIDLGSAPLDVDEGAFGYQSVTVGYGPCSVSLFTMAEVTATDHAASDVAAQV